MDNTSALSYIAQLGTRNDKISKRYLGIPNSVVNQHNIGIHSKQVECRGGLGISSRFAKKPLCVSLLSNSILLVEGICSFRSGVEAQLPLCVSSVQSRKLGFVKSKKREIIPGKSSRFVSG